VPVAEADVVSLDGSPTFAVRDVLSVRRFVALMIAALAVLCAASAVAWDGTVPGWEAELLRTINGWPDWLEPILWFPQQAGVLAAPVIGGALIAWSTRRWHYAVPFVLLVPIKLSIEWLFLKQVVERERPYVTVGTDIELRGTPIEGLGFPSGHATTAFAFAVLVVAFLPARWRPVPLLLALVVGVARLYSGAHNVLDVVAGAAVGTIFACVLWFTMLNRFVEDDNHEAS
jgi:membrane-associated phospholipid phosphatase